MLPPCSKLLFEKKIRSIFVFKRKAWNQFKEKLQRDTQKNIEIKKKEPEVEIGHTVCQMINFCPKIQVFHFKAEQKVKIFESVLEHGFQEKKSQSQNSIQLFEFSRTFSALTVEQ